jgi:hypothetical protein
MAGSCKRVGRLQHKDCDMKRLDSKDLFDLLDLVTSSVGRKITPGLIDVQVDIDQTHAQVLRNLAVAYTLYINNIAIGLAAYRKLANPGWTVDMDVGQDGDGIFLRIGLPPEIVGAVVGSDRQNTKTLAKLYAPLTTQTKPEWTVVEVLDRRQL